MNILLLFGGVSSEHDISIKSATSIFNILNEIKDYNIYPVYISKDGFWKLAENGILNLVGLNKKAILSPESTSEILIIEENSGKIENIKIDVAFPVLHGKNGEDGTIQGLFHLANMKYVGCGVASSANSMDKSLTKIVVDTIDVPQSDYILVKKENYSGDLEINMDFPVFVKPCSSGSSVGVSKVENLGELNSAIDNAFLFDSKVLVEKGIFGREIEVAVLGNEKPVSSVVGEIQPASEFYSFDAKYEDVNSQLHIPARISENASEKVREYAVKIYKALECNGLSRVDFFITENEEIIFNEINTMPGFTNISMYPKLFEYSGIPYNELLKKLILFALEN